MNNIGLIGWIAGRVPICCENLHNFQFLDFGFLPIFEFWILDFWIARRVPCPSVVRICTAANFSNGH